MSVQGSQKCQCYVEHGIYKDKPCPNRARFPPENPKYCSVHFKECKHPLELEHTFVQKPSPKPQSHVQPVQKPTPKPPSHVQLVQKPTPKPPSHVQLVQKPSPQLQPIKLNVQKPTPKPQPPQPIKLRVQPVQKRQMIESKNATFCDHLSGMSNNANSCYVDSLIFSLLFQQNDYIDQYLLHSDTLDIVSRLGLEPSVVDEILIFTQEIQKELQHLKSAILQDRSTSRPFNCNRLRNLLNKYQTVYNQQTSRKLQVIAWTSKQYEPFDLMLRLTHIFGLPPSIHQNITRYLVTSQGVQYDSFATQFISTVMIGASQIEKGNDVYNLTDLINQVNVIKRDQSQEVREQPTYYYYSEMFHIHLTRAVQDESRITNWPKIKEADIPMKKIQTMVIPDLYYIFADKQQRSLTAIIVHHGGATGGHYVSYLNCANFWYLYDDLHSGLTRIGDYEELLSSNYGADVMSNGVDFFYM
jgi:hypothetical protein